MDCFERVVAAADFTALRQVNDIFIISGHHPSQLIAELFSTMRKTR